MLLRLLRLEEYSTNPHATWVCMYKFSLKAVNLETVEKVKLQLKTSQQLHLLKETENERLQNEIEQLEADNVALKANIAEMATSAEKSRLKIEILKSRVKKDLEEP